MSVRINPSAKTVTYSLDALETVEAGLDQLQKEALECDDVTPDRARSTLSDLNMIRDALQLKGGIRRHEKFAPELQKD